MIQTSFLTWGPLRVFILIISATCITQALAGERDPDLDKYWQLKAIGVPFAWRVSMGSKSTPIAIVDSGIDFKEVEVLSNIVPNSKEKPNNGIDDDRNGYIDDVLGWDYIHNKPIPQDKSMHGTWLASMAVGKAMNGRAGAGVCPNCGLIPVRFINFEGLGDTEDAIKGIYYAVDRGARVINLSFAGEGYDADLSKALRYAEAADVVVVVAAGNDGEDVAKGDIYPAKHDFSNMIKVAAIDSKGKLWKDSNYSKRHVDIAAPGVDVYGIWEHKVDYGSGTSNATAITSGAIGLLRTIAPRLKAPQIKELVKRTVTVIPGLETKVNSSGVLNLKSAIEHIQLYR